MLFILLVFNVLEIKNCKVCLFDYLLYLYIK